MVQLNIPCRHIKQIGVRLLMPSLNKVQSFLKSITVSEILVFVWVFLELVLDRSTLAETYPQFEEVQKIYKLILFCGILVFTLRHWGLDYFIKRRSLFLLLLITFSVLAGVIYVSRSAGLYLVPMLLVLLVIGLEEASINRLAFSFSLASIAGTVFIVLLSYFGIILNRVFVDSDGTVLSSYGYGHPNTFAGELFALSVSVFYATRNKRNHKVVTIVVAIVTFLLNLIILQSRTVIVLLLILVVMTFFEKELAKVRLETMSCFLIGALIFFSLYFTFFFNANSSLDLTLSSFFNGRLDLMYQAFKKKGLHLFGLILEVNPIYNFEETGIKPNGIDNGYIKFLLNYGILLSTLMLGLFVKAFNKCRKLKDNSEVIFVTLYALYMFVENIPLYPCFNFTFIFLAQDFLHGINRLSADSERVTVYSPLDTGGNPYCKRTISYLTSMGYTVISLEDWLDKERKATCFSNVSLGPVVNLNWFDEVVGNRFFGSIKRFILKEFKLLTIYMRTDKIVITVHNSGPHDTERKINVVLSKLLRRTALSMAKAIIVMNRMSLAYLKVEYGDNYYSRIKNKISIIPHENYSYLNSGINRSERENERNNFQPTLLFFGMVRPYKGTELIVEAARNYSTRENSPYFLIVGKCVDEEYSKWLSDACDELNNIRFENRFVPDSELISYVRNSDAVILPFRGKEMLNSGSCIFSFTFGKPVIAPIIGTVVEMDSQLNYLYQLEEANDDLKPLLHAIDSFLMDWYKNPKIVYEKGLQLKLIIKKDNSYECVYGCYKNLYQQIDNNYSNSN